FGFPLLPRNAQTRLLLDHISYEQEHAHVLESWAFFKSGLFTNFSGLIDDWRSDAWWTPPPDWKPGTQLELLSTLGRFLEIFQLAASLALSPFATGRTVIESRIVGLRNRSLWLQSPRRMGFYPDQYRCDIPDFPRSATFETLELQARHRELAIEWAMELFRMFRLTIEKTGMQDLANEVLPRR
ncbi:MAG TPA: hypothetical protein VLT82_08390, partial [Myxococcaceae bacterium]|nr:hypothetical protein [Myxococcaceae bacterium]